MEITPRTEAIDSDKEPLDEGSQLDADEVEHLFDLRLRDNIRISFGQTHQLALTGGQHHRQLLHELCNLARQKRQQKNDQQQETGQEDNKGNQHRQHARNFEAGQMDDHSVQQIGDDGTRKYRNQHVAEHEDKDESEHQHESENQYLRIGKVAVNPVANQLKHSHL